LQKHFFSAKDFEGFSTEAVKKELVALKTIYGSLAKKSGLVAKGEEEDAVELPTDGFYVELAKAPAITLWNLTEKEDAEKNYGVGNYADILAALSDPLAKVFEAEGVEEKIAALKAAKKHPSTVTEGIVERYAELEQKKAELNHESKKEVKDALAKDYAEFFDSLNSDKFDGKNFVEHAKEHASDTVSREFYTKALAAKKPAKHLVAGGSLVEALGRLGDDDELDLLGIAYKKTSGKDLTLGLIHSDDLDDAEFSKQLLASIKLVMDNAKATAISLKASEIENEKLKAQLKAHVSTSSTSSAFTHVPTSGEGPSGRDSGKDGRKKGKQAEETKTSDGSDGYFG